MPQFDLADGTTNEIDLGNSKGFKASNIGEAKAEVYVDRKSDVNTGGYTSAVRGSAGYRSPIALNSRATKEVSKADLESEHIRVGVRGDGAKVQFEY